MCEFVDVWVSRAGVHEPLPVFEEVSTRGTSICAACTPRSAVFVCALVRVVCCIVVCACVRCVRVCACLLFAWVLKIHGE